MLLPRIAATYSCAWTVRRRGAGRRRIVGEDAGQRRHVAGAVLRYAHEVTNGLLGSRSGCRGCTWRRRLRWRAGRCILLSHPATMPPMPSRTPPRRSMPTDPTADMGEDGSLMLRAYGGRQADDYWLSLDVRARTDASGAKVDLGFRSGPIARFGPHATIRSIAARMRCSACGGRRICAQVTSDCRGQAGRSAGRAGPADAGGFAVAA